MLDAVLQKWKSYMDEKLIIDLAKCRPHAQSSVQCSYKHHPGNRGVDQLLEMIRFTLVCRRCKAAPCVAGCPNNALEKKRSDMLDDEILCRASMLCSGCGTCAIACPFGTIFTDLIPYVSNVCDLCRGRLSEGEKPLCVSTCQDNSIEYCHVDSESGVVEVFDGIAVKVDDGQLWEPLGHNNEKAKK